VKRLPPQSASSVRAVLARLGLTSEADTAMIVLNEEHSNSVAEVRLPDGRMLIVKRARYLEMAERFDTARAVSLLVHEHTELLAPRYFEVPDEPGEPPVLVHEWIPNPTLEDIWPELDVPVRERALHETGRLLRRIHRVPIAGHGMLPESLTGGTTLLCFLEADLLGRLGPAIAARWRRATKSVDRLYDAFAEVLASREDPPAVLVHNDLFAANVLCAGADADLHCAGVLDFDDAFAGPIEADLAKTEVLHGPLFGRQLRGAWFEYVLEGYGDDPDAVLIALFRAYHLLNMGYHAAVTRLHAHATEVAGAVERELDRWEAGERHRVVLG
jgi:aminoglycoside phosphotransferase (APT) family kinase protein